MSQIQLHSTTSSELPGRRRWPLIVPALFTLSFLLVIYMVVDGIVFGVKHFYQYNPVTADVPYTLSVWAWTLAAPLATMLAGVSAAIAARTPRWRLWLMIGVLVLAFGAPLIFFFFVPWAGSGYFTWSPWVFGVGGVLIITSVLLTCWFWAQERAKPRPVQQRGAELRLIAYVLFGMAAWWTCGVASRLVLFGGRLPELESVQVSIYSIMADLVLGWGLLLASYVLASLYWLLGSSVQKQALQNLERPPSQLANRGGLVYHQTWSPASSCSNDDTFT
jgi:MFS family permease